MAEERTQRRLAAILAADVVGYSRLMEQDEAGTLAAIRDLRREVIDPLLSEHQGRIVKLMGDGALVEFGSVVDAVACAVAIQKGVAARQADVPAERRIVFRIGINLGDVVVEGDDLLGDGVNVAARLEQLCEPGGVLVSGTAFDQLQGKLGLPLDFSGEQHVKNIARPVRTYRVRLNGGRSLWRFRVRQHLGGVRLVAAAFVALLLAGGAAWWLWPTNSASTKSSIAVLPFDNYGDDPKWGRFADGLTEDIITDLARSRDLNVIARNSTEVYRDKRADVRQIAQDLGVRYILEGSLQADGDKIRVTAQLIDASTSTHIWTERYDRPATDLFLVQDEITKKISATISGYKGVLFEADRAAAHTKSDRSLQAYDYWLLGGKQLVLFTEEGLHTAQSLFHRAVELDPNFEPAVRDLGIAYMLEIDFGISQDIQKSIEIHGKYTRRALELDPADAFAVYQLGNHYVYRGQLAAASEQYEKALALGPNDADLLHDVAWVFPQLGLTDRAVELAEQAVRLNPHYPHFYNYGFRQAYFYGRKFEKALKAQLAIGDAAPLDKIFLAMIYVQLGESDKAAHAAAAVREADPNWSAEQYASDIGGFVGEAEVNLLIESAKKAGLPGCLTADQLQKRPDTKRLKACDTERAQP